MSKIRESTPKNTSGAYVRMFNHNELGYLVSKIQSTSISAGNELERIIIELTGKSRLIQDVDKFLEYGLQAGGYKQDDIFLLTKSVLKQSKIMDTNKIEPDYVVFKINQNQRHCYIIELKDGHVFDTKKSKIEKTNLQSFETKISRQIQYTTSVHICSFNKEDKNEIKSGFKNTFSIDEILTGRII